VARVVVGGKVRIPLLVREVLKIREGDYVRLSISQVIKKEAATTAKGEKWAEEVSDYRSSVSTRVISFVSTPMIVDTFLISVSVKA